MVVTKVIFNLNLTYLRSHIKHSREYFIYISKPRQKATNCVVNCVLDKHVTEHSLCLMNTFQTV